MKCPRCKQETENVLTVNKTEMCNKCMGVTDWRLRALELEEKLIDSVYSPEPLQPQPNYYFQTGNSQEWNDKCDPSGLDLLLGYILVNRSHIKKVTIEYELPPAGYTITVNKNLVTWTDVK